MDGVALAARFSLPTNRRNFCGPSDAEPSLYRAATEGTDLGAARRALEQFEALTPYLRAIGERSGLDPFDERVVEAYWIGNSLLDGFGRDAFVRLLDGLRARGLPTSVARRLQNRLPGDPIPHHLFHVAFVGVGAVTGHVPTTLPNMELCRPAWAVVRTIASDRIVVDHPELGLDDRGRFTWGPATTAEAPYDARLLPGLREGATVALHWATPVLELSSERRRALIEYSKRSLSAANEALGTPVGSGVGAAPK